MPSNVRTACVASEMPSTPAFLRVLMSDLHLAGMTAMQNVVGSFESMPVTMLKLAECRGALFVGGGHWSSAAMS